MVQSANSEIEARILIVDDEPAVRMMVAAALRRAGRFELHEASDGVVAKALLQQELFDLVITDLSMPHMNGIQLLKWASEQCPGPAWIILSGQASVSDAIKAIRLGAFDFITKPLRTIDALIVTVRNALRLRALETEHRHLDAELQKRNAQLARQVANFGKACSQVREYASRLDEPHREEFLRMIDGLKIDIEESMKI